jgi:hypothetical protein
VRAATRELGVKRTTAQRAVKIASNLTKTAHKAAERLGLDNNQKALEAAAGVPGEYQVDILENFVKKRKARQAVKDQIAENLARPPTTSGKELFFRMLEQLDIDQRMLVRIWLLGADLETCFAEHDKAQELLRADRRSLH